MKNKFMKVYEEIAAQIQQGILMAGSLLPSENELTAHYKTSRETIRKALNLLSEEGYIHKVQGKGSIVLDVKRFDFPISGLTSFKEVTQKMGQRAKTHVVLLERKIPESYIKEQLKLDETELVWDLTRVREIDGERIILDKDYLTEKVVPFITEEICRHSIYEYLEGELGLSISFAKKVITVEEPTEEDKRHLDLTGFQNMVVVKNYVYLDDASLFQYTESRHRPDKFRFVDFARRK
ncbi:trehalose operon repressor [Peribacillus cavernae]|uniref:Trehalose operon repressor n=1 Tax=Peribacillus cavernae TaxID=1674310 RepID=A0A3S0U221_9BACI|nr:trehalose operon repressor [Peribacillus cavernae]MDQ0219100.1 GntR family trehalose operon transcriptional repressor [Peribacillus cavernae]RUQ28667.1 trehalose operon repressor [Peribacillus cavernae]